MIVGHNTELGPNLTGEGNGKPFQFTSYENPMNCMTRQKVMTPKDEPPTIKGVQYATGEEQRATANSSRKNKVTGRKLKQHSIVNVSGDESKIQYYKEQYCIGTWNVWPMSQDKWDVVKQETARVNIDTLGMLLKLQYFGHLM